MTDSENAVTIPAAGIEFQARRRGEVPEAIFLHGFGGDLHTWDRLWSAPGWTLPALRYDLRGFGRTGDTPGQGFSHTSDLHAIVEELGGGPVDLVGVSMGGSIAVNFSLDYPAMVRRLVLISPALVAWEWSEEWRALWRPIVDRARSGNLDGARDLWWQHPLFASTRDSPAGPELHSAIQRFAGRQWIADEEWPRMPDVERLHRLEPPTLLLTGELDLADFRLIAALLEGAAPDLRRIDYRGTGHMVHLERAAESAQEIEAFLVDSCIR